MHHEIEGLLGDLKEPLFIPREPIPDMGVDFLAEVLTDERKATNWHLAIQLRSKGHPRMVDGGAAMSIRFDTSALNYLFRWHGRSIVVAYDDAGVRILKRATGLLGVPRRGWPELFTIAGQLVFERPSLYALPAALPLLRLGETIYREPRPLRRPTPVSSPVIVATWHLAEREVETRRRNAMRLLSALRWLPGFKTISSPMHARPSYLRLPVLVSPAVRPLASQRGARRLGIMPGYPQPLSDLERFSSRCLNRNGAFPGSRLLVARLCTLPTHGRLRGSDLERLEVWIRTVGGREDALPITPSDR